MKRDKVRLYLLEIILIILLFLALFVSRIFNYRILALALGIFAIVTRILIKKNQVTVYTKKQVFWVMLAFAVIYLLGFYLMGVYFGFYRSSTHFNLRNTWLFIIPFSAIIVFSEYLRSKFLTKPTKLSNVLTFIAMVLVDVIVYAKVYDVTYLDDMLTVIGYILFASIACNLLYNYITVRFGSKPVIIYRLITVLYSFVIPYIPDVYIFFRAFLRMLIPYIIYLVLEYTYAKNNYSVAYKDKKKSVIETTVIIILMSLLIGLISCRFEFGIIVIGSGSMTGTINKGDATIFQQYHGQALEEGTVIIFNDGNIQTVHRIVKAENVNGEFRYHTKGDANSQEDDDYRLKSDIIGISRLRVPYIGWPTLWLRDIFKK